MTHQKKSDCILRVESTGRRKFQYEISFFRDTGGL